MMSHKSTTELLVQSRAERSVRRRSRQWAYAMEVMQGFDNSFPITPRYQDNEAWIRDNTGPTADSGNVVSVEECVL